MTLLLAITLAAFIDRWEPVEQMLPPVTVPKLVTPPAGDPLPPQNRAQVPHREPVHRDICARTGGHKVNYMRDHHPYWRCAYSHRRG